MNSPKTAHLRFWIFRSLVAITALEMIGCSSETGPSRFPISGTVRIDGQPLEAGTITFLPESNHTAVSSDFTSGAYSIGSSAGPAAGRYLVEIVSVKPTGKIIRHPDLPSETTEEVRNIVPTQYNTKTSLKIEVKPDAENKFDFELSSREKLATKRR